MHLQHHFSLKPFNTFGIDVLAKSFGTFSNIEELTELLAVDRNRLVLGGGSNILFLNDFNGIVVKNDVKGIHVVNEDAEHVYVKCGAGENWHQFVMFCILQQYAGVENLSLIPGNTGASPMQNIGAYGVEIKDVFHELEAFDIEERKTVCFSKGDCEFGYRESVFKNRYKGRFVILTVTFKLNKNPVYHTSYGAIEVELQKMNAERSIQSISQAVINIRRSKLPDPKEIGNAGSFFKNPSVSATKFAELQQIDSTIPGYPQTSGDVKLAAGWLIEKCGWKGYRRGDAGCHARQALVLVNYGNARGGDIYQLSEEIQQSVRQKFNVQIEREVNII